jgi:putative molybdopterin biosynthesis protein
MIGKIPVIGVPGYPVSAALTGELFVQPLLGQWLGAGQEVRPRAQASMTRKVLSPIGDDDFVRVTVAQVGERLLATPLSRGAGVITSLVRADGLAHIPRFSEGVEMGQSVEVMLYRSLDAIRRRCWRWAATTHDRAAGAASCNSIPGFRLASARRPAGRAGRPETRRGASGGSHLLDPETGEYNISYIRRYLRKRARTGHHLRPPRAGILCRAGESTGRPVV